MNQISRKTTNFVLFLVHVVFYIFFITKKLNNLLVISSKYPYGKNTVESNPKKK